MSAKQLNPAYDGMTDQQVKRFKYWEFRTMAMCIFGYALFYFVRKNLSIAMPYLNEEMGISKSDLGLFLTLHGLIYGLSKFFNGIWGDRSNARYFLVTGLVFCGICNLLFGFSSSVLALGISTFVMLSTESLLSISFSSSLARYGGDVAVGAMTVITSASQLCTLPIQGICQGGQPVMSFNFGAGKKLRVKEAFRFQLTLCSCYTCLFWLLMMLAPGAVAGIFTSDTALIDYTTWSMRIYMAGIFAMGFQIACQQSFMALGQAKVSLLLACLRKIILLIPLIFILPHLLPNPVFGVFLAEPVSDILAATITTITFFSRFNGILERGAAKV